MKYRQLGTTGILVSEIGFGAWGIGGAVEGANSYGATDDAESKKVLEQALELGVTFYDTADIYGYGHSEELLGEAFKNCRDQVVIASKVGFVKHSGPHDFSPRHIRRSLEGTLTRLKSDYVDLYQLHSPPLDLLRKSSEAFQEMQSLKKEGKIRAIGISVKGPEDGIAAIEEFGAETVQVNFNMIDQRALECGLFDCALKQGVGIIARTPLAFGFLTGKVKNLNFDSKDHRSIWPASQLKRWADAPDVFSFINQGKERTPAQLALQFCLSFNEVAAVIPGMLDEAQVRENVRTSDLAPLDSQELDAIKFVYKNNEFFDKSLKGLTK